MIIDWRSLLGSLHVEWRDRGSNCRAGNINISCPWCRDDPSFHLGISENREAYYCYRDPDRHSGKSFISLLIRLGNSRNEALRLLNAFLLPFQPEAIKQEPIAPELLRKGWNGFEPASNSRPALAYLSERGIPDPISVCKFYDLRVAIEGTWAQRLLIPFKDHEGVVETWTGRDLTGKRIPKYLTKATNDPGQLYVPDWMRGNKTCLVICEGPFDALKLAIIARRSKFVIAALTGKDLNAKRLLKLRALGKHCDSVLVTVDADVSIASRMAIISNIACVLPSRYIGCARLPQGYKDPAELEVEGALEWMQSELTRVARRSG